jgi:hypothetical protein
VGGSLKQNGDAFRREKKTAEDRIPASYKYRMEMVVNVVVDHDDLPNSRPTAHYQDNDVGLLHT